MARKDVDLVIRARDEAKGTLRAITEALEGFVGSQKELQQVAGKTDSTLDRLGASLTGLNKALGGVAVADQAVQQLNKAQRAQERLAKSTKEAAGEAIGYQREARAAARATEVFRAESERVAAAVERQSKAVQEARAAQSQLSQITGKAAAERQRLTAADEKLTAQIEEQRLKLSLAKTAFSELQREMNATTEPTKRLSQQFGSVGRAVRLTEEKLDELRTTQAVVRESIDATTRAAQRAQDVYGAQAATLNQQVTALGRMEAKQREVGQALSAASAHQIKLEKAAQGAAQGLEQQIGSLERSEAEYQELQTAVLGASTALDGLEKKVRGPLLQAFGTQRKTLAEARQGFEDARASATRLGQELARTSAPSEAMVAAFTRAREAANRAEAEYWEQGRALNALRAILRETGGDVDAFASRQQRAQAILNKAQAEFREYTAAARSAAAQDARTGAAATQATGATNRYSGALQGNAAAARRAAAENRTLAGAIRGFYGESRQALSFTQRLRSEVLALIAAYAGFFAAIQGTRRVIESFQALEAAQSRLNVVFEGAQGEIANELDFIRRQAERLGIEFGTLAKEYTKFAVATKGTNLEGAETRRIFVSVAEASRVNKASLQELQGVFVALTQIVSKGSVQMEELRQQLGDRLPGALQIMADGMGVSTQELIKMMEQGQVSSDRLSEFADELDRRFGAQVPAALKTTTTAIGRFQNALFQAFLRIAEGGFIDAFTDLMNDLTETLQSAQFESTLDRISTAMAGLTNAIGFAVRNFNLLSTAVFAFIGLKLAPFLILIASRMGILTTATVSTTAQLRALFIMAQTGATTMTRTALAVRGLTVALRGLLSSTGIGLLVVAIGAAIGAWVTRTDQATEALNEHQRIVDAVRDAYDQVGSSVDDWREKVEDLTVSEAQRNLERLRETLANVEREFRNRTISVQLGFFTDAQTGADIKRELDRIALAFQSGGLTVDALDAALLDLESRYEGVTGLSAEWRSEIVRNARSLEELRQSVSDARDVIIAKTGSAEEAKAALERLSGAVEDTADATDRARERLEKYQGAMAALGEFIPEVKKELEDLKEAADMKAAFQSALQLAEGYEEMLAVFTRYQDALKNQDTEKALELFEGAASGGIGAAAALIKDMEGFRATPYWDVNAFRVGFGSDTITLSDGTIKKVTEGMRVSVEDAMRDLIRRIGDFQDAIRERIGSERFESFSPEQQAVLTSIAYNYGELPGRIIEAVRTGSVEEIAKAIRSLSGDNEGVNRKRRTREALIFESGELDDQAYIGAREEALKLAEEEREEREKAQAQTRETIEDQEFEIEQQKRLNAEKEREAAIEEAIRKAKAENKDITDEQIAAVAQNAGNLFDLEAAKELREEQEKQAEATAETLDNLEFQTEQQRLLNAEKDREAAIAEAVRSARQENVNISERELDLVRQRAAELFDLQNFETEQEKARKKAEEAEKRINELVAIRQAMMEQLTFLLEKGGSAEAIGNVREALEGVNEQLLAAIDNALKMLEALKSSDPAIQAIIEQMKLLRLTSQEATGSIVLNWEDVEKVLATNIANAMENFAKHLHEGKSLTQSAHLAFLQFAADFLRQIAQMIIQQMALNAAKAIGKALSFGVAHEGGIVGAQTARRSLNPAVFAGAMRYHSGGIAGLQPGEVPTVLRRGEEVLTQDDPRHIFNMGRGGGDSSTAGGGVSIINAFDSVSYLEHALSQPGGRRVLLNFLTAKSGAVKAALGGGRA